MDMDLDMDMDKECVELIMSIESSFRNMYRRLFAMNTGNDFWKKIICEQTIREIHRVMNDPGEILSVVDVWVYNSEIQCLEEYLQEYAEAVPDVVDMVWIQKEYEKALNCTTVQKFADNRKMQLMFVYVTSNIRLMNLTPWEHHAYSDEFFEMIEKMGITQYAHDIVGQYFLIERLNNELEKIPD